MTYTRKQAIDIMNHWGSRQIPFFFIIDFEMESIRVFSTDAVPSAISFAFRAAPPPKFNGEYSFLKYPITFSHYEKAFSEVKEQILCGNSFLLNLTFATPIETNLTLPEIYANSYAKYKLLVDQEFVCFSPETFVTISKGLIASYPMKGTIKASEPEARKKILQNPKEIAEHHTIVDLIHNDLSMVTTNVTVNNFRYIDTIATNAGEILQVSSKIVGKLPENYRENIGSIIFTLLPAGSVTGAPKTKAVSIIGTVEKEKRGYYTGVCGIFDGSNLDSAVMIRFIECHENTLIFRSGGGITCNSNMVTEYNELTDKVYVPIV